MQPIYLNLSEKEILALALTQFIALMEASMRSSRNVDFLVKAAEDQRVARDLRAMLLNTSHGDF